MAYTVRSGDSMSAIAARHNVALSALLKANPQVKNANKIYPGQKLNIPGRKDDFVAAPAKSTTTSSSGTSYTVRSGDTMGSIAKKHGVTLQQLVAANKHITNANLIYPGQKLTIPGKRPAQSTPAPAPKPAAPATSTKYTVKSGDTLSAIAARHGTTVQVIAQANNISNPNKIYKGQVLTIPGKATSTTPSKPPATTTPPASKPPSTPASVKYTVKSGDTLSGIASRHGVSWQSIAQANNISNPNKIYPGQVLTIPNGKPSSSAPVTGPTPSPGPTKGGITIAQLRSIMPNLSQARAEQMLPHLNKAMIEGGINTPKRQAAFLAQLAHESGQLRYMEEIHDGSNYEGRKDLGNIYPGDGKRYKGRGPIQLTGRYNYRAAGKALGIDLENNPTRAADPDVGFRIAVWFWNSRNLNAAADKGDFNYITYRINGGYNGKADRERYYAKALQVLGA